MKKSFWVIFIILAIICVGAMMLKAESPTVADELDISSEAIHFKNGTKKKGAPAFKPVKLTHKKHASEYGKDGKGYGCKLCHHMIADDTPEEKQKIKKCSADGCHTAEAKDKCLELDKAMHQQCYKDCHKNDEAAKAAKAPTKCGDCHVKAEE